MNPILLPCNNTGATRIVILNPVYRLLLLFFIVMICENVHSQNPPLNPIIYQGWKILGEGSNHLDVSYQILKCDTVNKVHLKITSESNTNEVLHCTVKIVNLLNNENIVRQITMPVSTFQVLQPNCGNNTALQELVFDLPVSYNPMNITAIITF